MIVYKDVIKKMTDAGYNVSRIRREKLLSQSTLSTIRRGDTVNLESIDVICRLTGLPVEELIEYVPDENMKGEQKIMKYDKETAILIGETYGELLQVLNDGKHDRFEGTSDVFPVKCMMELVKLATPIGIPAGTDAKIRKIMDMIEPDELTDFINKPMPMEYRTWFLVAKAGNFPK